MPGIYVHIPFCRHACTYCDFHFSTKLSRKGDMVSAIVQELALRKGFLPPPLPLTSLYLGGGTPSVLEPAELAQLYRAIHRGYDFAAEAEFTLEVNPEDVNSQRLAQWKRLGINRLSVGIQSFFEDDLSWMNRKHSPAQAKEAVSLAKQMGFERISLDLIFGLPNQDDQRWQANVEQAIALDVGHLSLYSLTVSEKTALAHQVSQGMLSLPADETYGRQYRWASDFLRAAGYDHYELSSFAKPGQRAVHNSSYWAGEPYLGLGPSAHGYDGQFRYWNYAHNQRFLKAIAQAQIPEADREELSALDRYHDYLITHLRHERGIDPAWIE
ncbi:MAG: radical SAM family heme chaperone HemW, partial [Bacteroidota bacterium]